MAQLKGRILAGKVLVKPDEAEEKTASGIIIPDSAKEKPRQGTVVLVGAPKKDEEMEKGRCSSLWQILRSGTKYQRGGLSSYLTV